MAIHTSTSATPPVSGGRHLSSTTSSFTRHLLYAQRSASPPASLPYPAHPSRPTVPHPSAGAVVPVSLWKDELFATPPKSGDSASPWHQDDDWAPYTGPCNHLSVHIALDDQPVTSAHLHVVPASHTWTCTRDNRITGQQETVPLPNEEQGHSYARMRSQNNIHADLTAEQKQLFNPVPVPLKRGEMCILHALTIRAEYDNRGESLRLAPILHYMATGTQSRTTGAVWCGVLGNEVPIEYGQEAQRRLYPHVFKPKWLS